MEEIGFQSKIFNHIYYTHPENSNLNASLTYTLGDYKPCEEVSIFNDNENKQKGITLFDSLLKEIIEEDILDKRIVNKYYWGKLTSFFIIFNSGLISGLIFKSVLAPTFLGRGNTLLAKILCTAFSIYGSTLGYNYLQNKKNEFLMDLYLTSPILVKKYLVVKDYRYLMEYKIDRNDFKLPY